MDGFHAYRPADAQQPGPPPPGTFPQQPQPPQPGAPPPPPQQRRPAPATAYVYPTPPQPGKAPPVQHAMYGHALPPPPPHAAYYSPAPPHHQPYVHAHAHAPAPTSAPYEYPYRAGPHPPPPHALQPHALPPPPPIDRNNPGPPPPQQQQQQQQNPHLQPAQQPPPPPPPNQRTYPPAHARQPHVQHLPPVPVNAAQQPPPPQEQPNVRIKVQPQAVPISGAPPAPPAQASNNAAPRTGETRAREESQIVGSTATGSQVVMVTSNPQDGRTGGRTNNSEYRQLKVEDALLYLEQVKSQFTEQPAVYNQFLDIMKEFKAQSIDTAQVIRRVSHLFHGHKGLILGFNTFLPPGYKIELRDDPKTGCVTTGFSAPGGTFSALPSGPNAAVNAPQPPNSTPANQPPGKFAIFPPNGAGAQRGNIPPDAAAANQQLRNSVARTPLPSQGNSIGGNAADQRHANATGTRIDVKPQPQLVNQATAAVLAGGVTPAPTEAGKPIEFDQAVNYVNKIKSRFSADEAVYKRFLDILQTYQKEQRTIDEVYKQVSELFRDHADLLNEFSHFLPEAQNVAASYGHTQPVRSNQLASPRDPAAFTPASSQFRARAKSTTAPSSTPLASTKLTASSDRKGRKSRDGNTPPVEMQFFEEVRDQLGDSGAAAYKELIKCISLVAQEIINSDELVKLIDGLLGASHKHLTRAFRVFIEHGDPSAAERALQIARDGHEGALPPKREEQRCNPAYLGKRMSDIVRQFGEQVPGSAYSKYPADLGGIACSGMTDVDREVLNFEVAPRNRPPRLLDADTGPSPQHHVPLQHALAVGKVPKRPVSSTPESPNSVLAESPKSSTPDYTIEDQRHELDILIGAAEAACAKLDKGESLSGSDWFPLKLMYGDAFADIQSHLAADNNANALRTVHTRLAARLRDWTDAKKRMDGLWRTKSHAPGAKRFKHAEIVAELENGASFNTLIHTASALRAFVDELVWFVCEWTLDTADDAERVAAHVDDVFDLLMRSKQGEAVLDEHAYVLLRLLAEFTQRAAFVAEQGKLQETSTAVKSVMEGASDAAAYENWAKEHLGEQWQNAADLPRVAERFARSAISFPHRKMAYKRWQAASNRMDDGEGNTSPSQTKEGAESEDLVQISWEKDAAGGDNHTVKLTCGKVTRKRKAQSQLVRFIERIATKRRCKAVAAK